ncbi:unnamed protein product [Pedinophyceae sp. YPF-701]|nr:unnamed protein product [Pedinophyceae sp. YPF-701]
MNSAAAACRGLPARRSLRTGMAAVSGCPLPRGRAGPRRSAAGQRRSGGCARLRVEALDAAMPFDYESKMKERMWKEKQLKVGIVGFGNFGQFIAKRLITHGHRVIATSRGDYTDAATQIGASFFGDPDDFCEEHPDVVILCSSIISTKAVVESLPWARLRRSTLVVDVLSVKEFPKQLFLHALPRHFDLLCTHPMFGPDSGRDSWQGLTFMYERVRVGPDRRRKERCDAFLQFWEGEGCRMVEMTCEEHDRQAASSQFITHTVGRMLGQMELAPTDINTRGFESLLSLVNNTKNDSFDLYYGLFMYNQNATEELEKLEMAFDSVKRRLFDELHGVLRQQLFSTEKGSIGLADGGLRAPPPTQGYPMAPQSLPPPAGDAGGAVVDVDAVDAAQDHAGRRTGRRR